MNWNDRKKKIETLRQEIALCEAWLAANERVFKQDTMRFEMWKEKWMSEKRQKEEVLRQLVEE